MEEKGTIHIHLLTELTGNLYSEESEWEEDWSESDEYGMPLDGTELADYEEVIREELKRYGEDDLMQYFDGSESIQGKIQSAVVTIENKDGILYGCTKLELNELLSQEELQEFTEYITGQYSDGWGEGFEQRDIMRGSKYVPMSLQPYLYTKNNAIMYYDPSGMEEVTILSITRIAEEALKYSNRTDVNDDGKIKKLSEAYSQIAGMIRQDEYIPADLMRMLQEAERALKNVKGKSPQVDYEKYQIHIDACELAMTMIDNGFDEEDAIGRLYMDQHFTRNNEQVDWSTTKFSPGEANENELISPYTMVASAKYMYDMEWKYDPNNEMRPGSVVCDSFLRVIAKLHFSNSGYKYHEKNGNLKSTPNYVYNSSGKLIKMIQKGSIFNNDGTLTENAQKYMTEGTAAVRLDYPNKTNHIGISGYRLTARNGDLILPIYHAANKKDNAKIDYINLTTGRQYFSPQYNKKRSRTKKDNVEQIYTINLCKKVRNQNEP